MKQPQNTPQKINLGAIVAQVKKLNIITIFINQVPQDKRQQKNIDKIVNQVLTLEPLKAPGKFWQFDAELTKIINLINTLN